MKINKWVFVFVIALVITSTFYLSRFYYISKKNFASVFTNEEFIKGIYNSLDMSSPKEVFRYVFNQLEEDVVIYPTENYFYFIFFANGKSYKGSICLFTKFRDEGKVQFGYIENGSNSSLSKKNLEEGGCIFSEEDGIKIKKEDSFRYEVTFENKTVSFRMNDVGNKKPDNLILAPDEVYVGPNFDESGLTFSLIFNSKRKNLFWVLNESMFPVENFTTYGQDVLIGNRTDFAFLKDSLYKRKVLIAVKGENVLSNNWYDGPFDQMPDNYVYDDKIEIKKYLELAYPQHEGKIDKYGNFLKNPERRIPVANYSVYYSTNDVTKQKCWCDSVYPEYANFIQCITRQNFRRSSSVADNLHIRVF